LKIGCARFQKRVHPIFLEPNEIDRVDPDNENKPDKTPLNDADPNRLACKILRPGIKP
jgi:hypothetical protein